MKLTSTVRRPGQSFQELIPRRQDDPTTILDISSKTRAPRSMMKTVEDDIALTTMLQETDNHFQYAVVNPAQLYIPKMLTNLSVQTAQAGWVADAIAPPFKVKQSSFEYLEWTPATTHRLYDNEIKAGEEPKEIGFEATRHTVSLLEYALANRIYKRDIQNSDSPVQLKQKAAFALHNAMKLSKEARVLNVALSALVPGAAAGGGAWNTAAGTPITDVITGKAAIFAATQEEATDIVIPFHRVLTLINTTEWIARFGGFDLGYKGPLFKVQTGFENLGLRVHFSKVCALTTDQGTASDPNEFANIIGNQVLLFKRDDRPMLNSRCFMHAPFTVMGEISTGEWGLEKKTRSMYMMEYEETTELLVDANCGYRITGV